MVEGEPGNSTEGIKGAEERQLRERAEELYAVHKETNEKAQHVEDTVNKFQRQGLDRAGINLGGIMKAAETHRSNDEAARRAAKVEVDEDLDSFVDIAKADAEADGQEINFQPPQNPEQ